MQAASHTSKELEHRRRLAVTRIQEGWSHTQVAAFLGVHRVTVGCWWARHSVDPVHGLDAKPRHGRPKKLTQEQEDIVLSWFVRSPTEFGFPNELWTAGRVAQVIERTFGVHFNSNYLSGWLARRRITPQKPEKQARERDPAKIEKWLANEAVDIKAKVAAGAKLVLIDEAGAMLAPLVRRTLAPRGRTPIIKHRARHREKVSLIAAIVLSTTLADLGLYFRTYPKDYVNNVKAAEFLRALLAEIPGEIVVVWDGGPMHKGEPIREVLRNHPRLSMFRLPPYCPHFNPVEYLWSWLKYGKVPNFCAMDAAELDVTVTSRLTDAKNKPELLRGFWEHCELSDTMITS